MSSKLAKAKKTVDCWSLGAYTTCTYAGFTESTMWEPPAAGTIQAFRVILKEEGLVLQIPSEKTP